MSSEKGFSIYHNLLIKASVEKVFDAISLPEHLNNWWSLKSSGEPKLGTKYNLNFTDQYNWFGIVSEVKQNELFFIKMTEADDDWNPTTFGFVLEPKDNGTYLRFSHTGWLKNNDHLKHSSFCWAMLLNGLKNYVEKGVIISFDKRE
ncbi:SRPBCC domain-containing protein [Pseudotenacibaculum sp. MALMAid0570]|uniref:SRPBCC family protein n=1 Tax=Pseudotenacibaculum sp. MALMAid0570 TaxID=3143938 RepID=UPI0032DE9A38